MASALNGTEPMTSVGLSFTMSFTESRRQQSPNAARPLTGATSAHHRLTPTKYFRAPIAQRLEVALGASETMRGRPAFRGWFTEKA